MMAPTVFFFISCIWLSLFLFAPALLSLSAKHNGLVNLIDLSRGAAHTVYLSWQRTLLQRQEKKGGKKRREREVVALTMRASKDLAAQPLLLTLRDAE